MVLFKHPIIFISNLFKVGCIWLADIINDLWNPFDEFTRPMVLKYSEPLNVKAGKFEVVLGAFYDQGIVYNSTINWDGTPADCGDQALWHGITVAMWAIKYSVTKDSIDLEKIRQGMEGLDLHQTAHGEPVRRLISGIVNPLDPKNTLIDDVSNDSATGHLLGIYYAWLYGDADIRQKATTLITGLADEIVKNNYCLVLSDGTPTTYGKLIDGYLTNPMGLTLCMAILLVAATITENIEYALSYSNVKSIYGSAGLYKYPKVSFLTWNNWNDDHRAAIHLSILRDLDPDDGFTDGLERIWRLNERKGNAWVGYLCAKHLGAINASSSRKLLNEFYVEDANNQQRINSIVPDKITDLGLEIFEYSISEFIKGDLVSTQPCPFWWTGAQDFRWQRRPYSIDDWIGATLPSQYFFGVDFLIAYWGFKQNQWL